MRTTFTGTLKTISAFIALVVGLICLNPHARPTDYGSSVMQAQGYSGAMPNVTATAATGLGLTYTAGTITAGGPPTQAITAGTLTATNTMTSCVAPAYTACNFIYWNSGTALLQTTSAVTAFTPGNVVVAFCTSTGGNITTCTPASFNSIASASTTAVPTGGVTGGTYFVSPRACDGLVDANPDTPNRTFTTSGTSNHPVFNLAVDNTAATHTYTFICNITPPTNISGRGVSIVDAVFMYGIQTNGATATQVAVEASGTFNGTTVFQKVAFPTPASSETSSTEEPTRADTGTLVLLPVKTAFNNGVTTAGRYYSQKFTPQTPFTFVADLTQLMLGVSIIVPTTQASIINTPGIVVHYNQ